MLDAVELQVVVGEVFGRVRGTLATLFVAHPAKSRGKGQVGSKLLYCWYKIGQGVG
jgi:hypothetical protein